MTAPLNTQEKIGPKSFVPEKTIHCKVIKLIIIFSSQLRYLFRSCLYTQIFKTNINLWSSTFQAFFPRKYLSIILLNLYNQIPKQTKCCTLDPCTRCSEWRIFFCLFQHIISISVSWLWGKYIATILCTKLREVTLVYVYRTSLTGIIWSTGTFILAIAGRVYEWPDMSSKVIL